MWDKEKVLWANHRHTEPPIAGLPCVEKLHHRRRLAVEM